MRTFAHVQMYSKNVHEYICDRIGVDHDCIFLWTLNIDENLSWFQQGHCDDVVNESDERGFGGTDENIMNDPHCSITNKKQVSLYSESDNDMLYASPCLNIFISNSAETIV